MRTEAMMMTVALLGSCVAYIAVQAGQLVLQVL